MSGGYAYLQDISGRDMGRSTCSSPLTPGSICSISGKEVEIESILIKEKFKASQLSADQDTGNHIPAFKVPGRLIPKPNIKECSRKPALEDESGARTRMNEVSPWTSTPHQVFKSPLLANTVLPKKDAVEPTPRHNPSAPNAVVMRRPATAPRGKQIVDVVVDPIICQHLREHQREGVKFLYECTTGLRDFDGQGAILADEMGLGKTLQTIALLWTLLKQNPIAGDAPVIKKALIVCPVTLVNNWRREFRKWLGSDRLGVYVFDDTKKRISDFTNGRAYSVMIIGYEKLRTVHEQLRKGHGIDIVIADEGHRLKTAKNKSALAIKSLDTQRRVILSGTPIQNDLSEFFMMVDFVNPDLLGSFKTFTKDFETPIVKSRQPNALRRDVEKGEAKSMELAELTSQFILRRSADILSKYLPSKTEYVLMCRPTNAQSIIYSYVLRCPAFQSVLGSWEAALPLITILKKVCNSPYLLKVKASNDASMPENPLTASLLASIPPSVACNNQGSAKLRVLDQLLHKLSTETDEKIVLVSNYTSTLDIIEALVTSLGYCHVRLDGSTPSNKRQDIVDTFNRSSATQCFAFLLSAKSGGVGLNLIGASRLVLFDVDWNPATDLQAMARIHRDGQKRPCVIYRFLLAGGIDEKIWQRQVTKLGLASNIMDKNNGSSQFSKEELKDIFRLGDGDSCQTHDLIGCTCGGRGLPDDGTEDATEVDTDREQAYDREGYSSEELQDDSLPTVPELVQANKIDMVEQERKLDARQRASRGTRSGTAMDSLMAYSHIDTSKFSMQEDEDMEALIHDQVLLDILKDEGNRITFAFAKTSG